MKKSATTMAAAFAISFGLALPKASAFRNEPKGFRGIKWRTKIDDLSGMTYAGTEAGFDEFIRYCDPLEVGDVSLDGIRYCFIRGRFCKATLGFSGNVNANRILLELARKYGEPYRDNEGAYCWNGKRVFLYFWYDQASEDGLIVYLYKPLIPQRPPSPRPRSRRQPPREPAIAKH